MCIVQYEIHWLEKIMFVFTNCFEQIKSVAGDPSFLILHLQVVQFTIDLHTQYGARDIVNSSEY